LDSDDKQLVAEAQAAILEVRGSGKVQVIELVVAVGAIVFAIGLLSKVEIKDGKLTIHKGFPDLEKVPGLVKAFLGGGAEESKG
jgi:hypothetical protein